MPPMELARCFCSTQPHVVCTDISVQSIGSDSFHNVVSHPYNLLTLNESQYPSALVSWYRAYGQAIRINLAMLVSLQCRMH